MNRLGQNGPAELQWDIDRYAERIKAFSARAAVVDGHDLGASDHALSEANSDPEQPSVVLARTTNAKGIPHIENNEGWHGYFFKARISS